MTKVTANSPALLKGYLALADALGGGVLPAAIRERLAVATAEYNGCAYCLSAHTYIGANIAKVDAEELDKARDAKASDPHIAALLSLSDATARSCGHVDDADVQAARDAGVTETAIGEVVGHLALNVLTTTSASCTSASWPRSITTGPSSCRAHTRPDR